MKFNKALRALLFTNGFILLAAAMLAPIYALFVEGIGGSLLDASITQGTFALAAGLTTLIAGRYADKIVHEERIIIAGYLIMSVGFFLYSYVQSLWMLLAVQALIGFAEAGYSPAFDSLYSKHLAKTKMAREWGAWESLNYFSITFGAVLGGLIATYFGFIALFYTMSALCFLSALYLYLLPKKVL